MSAMDEVRPIEVLLVEDDPGDALITREALGGGSADVSFHHVTNGEDALAFLRTESPFETAARPDLVLLDLNLPRVDGREVLTIVKQDDDLRRIPVVVLTTSEADEDVLSSYDLHANAYISKPVDFDRFTGVVRHIDEFFISVAKLPPR